MKYINEIQMFLTGTLGIALRYAYIKRKEIQIPKLHVCTYFVISFGMLLLIILFLRDKESIFGCELDDGTKMIISAIASLFSERFFTFLMDRDEAIFNKLYKKYFGNDG